jgi:hypothetical protein
MTALTTDGQQHFGCGVHVLKAQVGIEQNGGSGEVIE